jgi:uncharacterized protein (TIGR02270 family)
VLVVIPAVLSQHAEEAAFHWLLRDAAVGEPHYSLADLAALDDRLDAHLDGLRIAGDAGWEIAKGELAWEEAGEVFTGGVLAFEGGDPLRVEEMLAVADQSVELVRGAISALGWLGYEQAYPYIRQLFASDHPIRRRIAVGAMAVQRQDPGPALTDLVRAAEPLARARALKAIGELGRYDLLGDCRANLEHEDEECRFWGARSGALMGDPAAIGALQITTAAGGLHSERACELAARRLEPSQALAWQRYLASEPQLLRLASKAAGAIGDPVLMPWLFQLMSVDEHARVAGEAFTTMTGVDLAYDDLERDWPEGFEAGPTENPEDEDVAMDPDEDLPWPHTDLIASWWQQNGGRFTPGGRYLLGQPITPESLVHALRTGKQRQRAAAALEIAFRRPGKPLFEVRARGDRQRRQLGA